MLNAGERLIYDTRVVRNDATGAVDVEDGQGGRLNVVIAVTDPVTGFLKGLSHEDDAVVFNRPAGVGNIGTRIHDGRMGTFDNSTAKTFRAIFEVAPGVDAVRPIFGNGNTGATYTVAACNLRALANLTSSFPSLSGIGATACALPSSGVVPVAPGASRRGYLLGNWTDLSSVARDDGGSGALVCIDAYVSTAATITIMGNGGSDDYAGWASRTNRKALFRYADTDCVTTPANFTSATNRIQSPIIGLQYAARGRVITSMVMGDSVASGRGTIIAEGFNVLAAETVSVPNGPYVETINCAIAGVGSSIYRYLLEEIVSAGIIPDVVVSPNGSPNDYTTALSTSEILESRKGMANLLRVAHANKIVPLLWTVLPTNIAVKNYGANDANRVAYNTETLARSGITVMDFSAALSGTTTGGQVEIAAGMTSDGIHPNTAGNTVMAALLAGEIKKLL